MLNWRKADPITKSFKFVVNTATCQTDDAVVAGLPPDIDGKQQLLHELSERLSFPVYFGFNWDALSDCLRDLHWVDKKDVSIIHDELPKLGCAELRLYISILMECTDSWLHSEEHNLEVVFP